MKPTEIYVRRILPLIESSKIKGLAHITGGGLLENVNRTIPANLKAHLDAMQWDIPPVFAWIATRGEVWRTEIHCTSWGSLEVENLCMQDSLASMKCYERLIAESAWL